MEKVNKIIDMLKTRGRFNRWWDDIKDDYKNEIKEDIRKIIEEPNLN